MSSQRQVGVAAPPFVTGSYVYINAVFVQLCEDVFDNKPLKKTF